MGDSATTIDWRQEEDGVVVLTFDDPSTSANTMCEAYRASMEATLERLEAEREEIAGVVLTSAKRTFFAGGDLNELLAVGRDDEDAFAAQVTLTKRQLRRLETFGRPVVAAVAGAALGGGLELALAAHHRVVLDDPDLRLGQPEVTLGLMPGAGGVTRSVRLLGIAGALDNLLLEGRELSPAAALELGLVDQLLASQAELIPAAKAWIAANPDAAQPWDREGYRLPGGSPLDVEVYPLLPVLSARLDAKLRGADYPAPRAILAAAVEGGQVDFETAEEIEGRYFVSLVVGPTAKNMIQAFFFDMQRVRRRRVEGVEKQSPPVTKVAVLGAGMMGAGIAYVCAKAGIEVHLFDVSEGAAEAGKGYSERLVARAAGRDPDSADAGQELLARIHPSADVEAAAGSNLMVEAVFEDSEVKAGAYAAAEPHLAQAALLASNTSTLPITDLAKGVSRPDDFLGLHFFSPVDRMPLLEIVRGERTSPQALARALDFARQIGKTPIVVNDSRGFYTSRVIITFQNEGMRMLAEGIPAPTIEQASAQAGYPVPVLQLCDELNLNLLRSVREETRIAVEAAGQEFVPNPADLLVDRMLDEFDRGGRRAGAGFYDYEDGRRVRLWPGLAEAFGSRLDDLPPLEDLKERMLFAESLESFACLEEGVIDSAADANIGSILGIGYPRWTGGAIQFAHGYEGGMLGFVRRAAELADRYGERFRPSSELLARTEREEAGAVVGAGSGEA
jgi:3-hydroxyacyl-CoA dehydrogenase/enoyl-CoA hydratase/3-hydroxybutyryl-CoA epimerase